MEALTALQSQVQVILDQLRTLSEQTDAHGATLRSAGNIGNINAVVMELQNNLKQLNSKEYTSEPQTKQQFLIHPKAVRVDDFYGEKRSSGIGSTIQWPTSVSLITPWGRS